MDVVLLLLQQIALMFLMMLLGYFFYKKKYITDQGSEDIKQIIVHLVLPVLVVNSLWLERNPANIQDLLHSTLLSFVGMLVSIALAMLLFPKKEAVLRFAAAFGNIGVIGIPMIQATFGSGAVFYISMMLVFVNTLQFTLGVYMLTGDPSTMSYKKIITNPVVISVMIGLLLFFFNVPRIHIVDLAFDAISGLNFPLALMLCGVYLAQSDLREMVKKVPLYYLSFVRLIVVPLVTILVFKFLPVGNTLMKQAILLSVGCPVGSNIAILASYYDADYRLAVETVCLSTLLCLFTLPILLVIATWLL